MPIDATVYSDDQLPKVIQETERDLRVLMAEKERRTRPRQPRRHDSRRAIPLVRDIPLEVIVEAVSRMGRVSAGEVRDTIPGATLKLVISRLTSAHNTGLINRDGKVFYPLSTEQ